MNKFNLEVIEDELRIIENALGFWDIMALYDRDYSIDDADKIVEKELHIRIMKLQGIQDAEKYH